MIRWVLGVAAIIVSMSITGCGKGIVVVDRQTLDVVGMIQVPGQLGPGHHIATDSKGNIYIAQTTAGMQKLVFKGMAPAESK
jgi:hypothetical protein